MPKVSVIVPVYNVAQYLGKCLDSVLSQSFREFELICVDDGSTDGSSEILKNYSKLDSRIKVVHQQNAGLGAARNLGVRLSKAPYLFFLDSDDWITEECLDSLYKKITTTKSDLCIYGLAKYDELNQKVIVDRYYDTSCYSSRKKDVCTYKEIKNFIFRRFGAVFKLYRRDLFFNNDLFFDEAVFYEDVLTHVKALVASQRICFVDKNMYFYRINRAGSIMTEISDPKKITDVFVYLEKVSSYLLSSKKYEELESDFIAFVLEQLTFHFRRQTVLKARFHEMARSFLKRYSRDQIQLSGPVALKQFDVLMQTKLSVIVPVYNAESYLKQCLDSILTQTLAEIEIICVNDGSTDSSLSILNEYAAKDSRFKILTQRNQKQGAARNNALKIATGEFVQFVDADDYLCPDACECIYNRMKTDALDMLSFGGTNFLHETGELEPNKYYEFEYLPKSWDKTIFNYTDCIEFVQKMAVSAALTAYNLEFLKQNKIIFPEQLFFEDNVFFAKSIFTAKRVGIEKRTLYYRRVHSNSTTQNWNKNFLDYLKVIRLVMDVVSNKAIPSEVTEIYREAYLSSCVRIFNSFEKVDQDKYSITLSKLLSDFKFSKIKPVSSIKGWCLGQLPLIVWNHNAKDKYLKILGLVVFHKKKKNNTSTIRLFSIPVYSKKVTNCSITKKILFVKYVRMWKK